MQLVLSLFSGIGLLDQAFREAGFCVVSAGDLITGQDIRDFQSLPDRFDGVIGGSPYQDFSKLKRNPTNYSQQMLDEYIRVVEQSQPSWYLHENVAGVPTFGVEGYETQRFDINQAWYEDVTRLRYIQFGTKLGKLLDIPRGSTKNAMNGCALASDNRSFQELCHLQGLPHGFDLPSFNVQGKKRAVGNGVPLSVGRALADAVKFATGTSQNSFAAKSHFSSIDESLCLCGCGRTLVGRKKYYDASCRKRAQRKREKANL